VHHGTKVRIDTVSKEEERVIHQLLLVLWRLEHYRGVAQTTELLKYTKPQLLPEIIRSFLHARFETCANVLDVHSTSQRILILYLHNTLVDLLACQNVRLLYLIVLFLNSSFHALFKFTTFLKKWLLNFLRKMRHLF